MATYHMDIDDIVSQAFIFFLAGTDSSSNFMCYFLQELSLNSDIQKKLRNEIDRCLDFGIYEGGNVGDP